MQPKEETLMFLAHSGDLPYFRVQGWLYFQDMWDRTKVNRWKESEFWLEIYDYFERKF